MPPRILSLVTGLSKPVSSLASCADPRRTNGHTRALGVIAVGVVILGAAAAVQIAHRSAPSSRAHQDGSDSPGPATPAAAAVSMVPADTEQETSTSAIAVLAILPVKGRAPLTGYSRDEYGPAWTDDNDDEFGHNGCDTRNDILRRDLRDVALESGSRGCKVETGALQDPYTARTIAFARSSSTSTVVQIDHVVALGDAWQTGAQQWTAGKRVDVGNDPLNLLAVDGPTNEAKGDADAASWLPPNKQYRCAYVARQVAVKAEYGLWLTQAEHDAIARVLSTCAGQTVPAVSGRIPPTATSVTPEVTTAPSSATPTAPSTPTEPAGIVYYANCAAVRAAGKAPLSQGQPGYRAGLDRDGNGIACE